MSESQRLKYLHGLEILDTDQEEIYDDIVATVASIFDCPIALVSLIDETRQWFKARYGLEVEQTPREYSFCSHAIEDNKLLVVIDAREDQRFKDNPLVTGDPHIVSYAGAPLIAPNGLKLGTLCVIDRRPREFTEEQLANLARLSRIVTKHLDKRYQERLLMKSQLFSAHVEKSSKTGGWEVDLVTDEIYATEGIYAIFDLDKSDIMEKGSNRKYFVESSQQRMDEVIEQVKATKHSVGDTFEIITKKNKHKWIQIWFYPVIKNGVVTKLRGTTQDVTLLIRANLELKRKNEYLDLALDGASLGIWDWNLVTNEVQFDKRWAQMLGVNLSDMKMDYSTWESRVHPDDIAKCFEAINDYSEGRTTYYENVHRMLHGSGQWVYMLGRGRFSEYDLNGVPTRFTGTYFDVTEQKKLEREFQEAQSVAKIGTWCLGLENNDLIWSRQMYDIFEIEYPQATSDLYALFRQRIHRDDLSSVDYHIQNTISGREEAFIYSHRISLDNGTRIKYIEGQGKVNIDENGKVYSIQGTAQDITDRVRQEDEFRFVVDSLGLGIWKVDLRKLYVDWDHNVLKIFDIEPSEFNNTIEDWVDRLPDEDREEIFKRALYHTENDMEADFPFTFMTKTGKRHMHSKVRIIRNSRNNAVMILGVVWDAHEEVLKEQKQKLEERRLLHHSKLASLGELAAGIGHEINNPLTVIKSYASLILEKKLTELDLDYLNSSMNKISVSANRIEKIVSGLKNFSRSDSSVFEVFCITELVEESINLISEIYSKEDIEVILTLPSDPLSILGNRGRIGQVLMNLLSNAHDALQISKRKRIKIEVEKIKDNARITISDTGVGIKPSDLDNIFEPFYTTKDINKGTGIGLSLVQRIIEEHHGSIGVDSLLNEGTSFQVVLPLTLDVKDKQPDVMPADNININYGHISVVVVDDEQLIGEVLGELLSEFTTNINTFTDPHEALKYIRQNSDKVDLVLSDIKMPKLDGIELLSQTQDLRGIVFYFISGGMNLSYQQRLKKLDFEGFIDKPFKPEDMSQIFKKHFKPL